MVSNKIKRTKRQQQTKRNTKKKNAKSRKNRMIGGKKRIIQYLDKTYNGGVWPELGMNIPHGKGTMTWNTGDVYDGQWRYGKMSGRGTMMWHNGTSYTGNWRSDNRNGFGTMNYENGKIAKGTWLNDNPTGDFEIIMPYDDPLLNRTITIPARDFDEFMAEDDDESDADTV